MLLRRLGKNRMHIVNSVFDGGFRTVKRCVMHAVCVSRMYLVPVTGSGGCNFVTIADQPKSDLRVYREAICGCIRL